MLAARWSDAIAAADELIELLPADLLRWAEPPLAHWLEGFVPVGLHVLVRFGKWRELIATALPRDAELYLTTVVFTHYAPGVAYSALRGVDRGEAEQHAFRAAVARELDNRMFFVNRAHDMVGIAELMLDGEIAYRRAEHDRTFALLKEAIRRDDRLPYDEPWGWMQPVRHTLGALLLEQGRVAEAADVYAADLGLSDAAPRVARHPSNPWALQGLAECLNKLGDLAGLTAISTDLAAVRAVADIDIGVSCFCRRSVGDGTNTNALSGEDVCCIPDHQT